MAESDAKALVPHAERIVDFYGDAIPVALVGDVPYVALRMFADYLGLDWSAQRRRTERDEVLASEVRTVLMTGADGRQREMVGLPLELLPGWLFGVTPNRVRQELREKVIRYRRHCFRVLWQAMQVEIFQTESLSATNPQAAEVAEQIETLTDVVNLLREHLTGLVTLPDQVANMSERLDLAVVILQSLTLRQDKTETQIARIDERTQRLTPAHARGIQEIVDRLVQETKQQPMPLTYAIIYGRLKHRFRVGSYREIADERYEEVIGYLREELSRVTDRLTPEQVSLF